MLHLICYCIRLSFIIMNAENILHRHNLKRTGCREGILDIIIKASNPLSENEIRERLPITFDRTTFYRSFKTLLEHNILHKIVVDNQLVKFGIGYSGNRDNNHAHLDRKSTRLNSSHVRI